MKNTFVFVERHVSSEGGYTHRPYYVFYCTKGELIGREYIIPVSQFWKGN
jgi:hypothetical protein